MEKVFNNTKVKERETEEELDFLRYEYFLNEVSEHVKSEFINNEIVIHSPAKLKHININTALTILFRAYVDENKLGWVASEKALVKMRNSTNSYEPDVCFFKSIKYLSFNDNTSVFPPPDLAIEILSKTSIKRDRVQKFNDYSNNDVEEYWIISPKDETIEQYYLETTGKYVLVKKYNTYEKIKSLAVKGFEIPVEAAFAKDVLNEYLFGNYKKEISDYIDVVKEKDKQLNEKDKQLTKKDQALEQKDQALVQKDQALEQKDQALEQKDQALEQNQKELNEQAGIIEQLKKQLGIKI